MSEELRVLLIQGPDGRWFVDLPDPDDVLQHWWRSRSGIPDSAASDVPSLRRLAQAVWEELSRQQAAFLKDGVMHHRALTRADLAEALSIHQSTVSRVLSGCVACSPNGPIPLEELFAPGIEVSSGSPVSATIVKALVLAEIARRPKLSDARIAGYLDEHGIHCARRTISKYREELGIPASVTVRHERLESLLDSGIRRITAVGAFQDKLRRELTTSGAQAWFEEQGLPRPPRPASETGGRGLRARSPAAPRALSDKHRTVLGHLCMFGELTPSDLEELRVEEADLTAWLGYLVARRPGAYVATPEFFALIDGGVDAATFTSRLAGLFLGEHLQRRTAEPIPELEEFVWERFGRWRLLHPNASGAGRYLCVPVHEARGLMASERLDLFSRLPPRLIGELIREADFVAEQQQWTAEAGATYSQGPLSTQMSREWKRPLLLSTCEIVVDGGGDTLVGKMPRADALERNYVVGGLPLCSPADWGHGLNLDRPTALGRLGRHPLATAILQLEVHRLFAPLSGDPAGELSASENEVQLEVGGVLCGPVWRPLRALLEQVGYVPSGASQRDSLWSMAVHVMLKNLQLLGAIERQGPMLRLSDELQSTVKAHPTHLLNRGEKPFRVRLSQYLVALAGGRA